MINFALGWALIWVKGAYCGAKMNRIFYIIGVVVVILFLLGYFGIRH
jgi:hypothetical protein